MRYSTFPFGPRRGLSNRAQMSIPQGGRRVANLTDRSGLNFGIPNDAPAPGDFQPPRLELRLDERHQRGRGCAGPHGGQEEFEGDEGGVQRHQIDAIREEAPGEVSCVDSFQADHSRVVAEGGIKLTVAHVHRVDLGGPMLEEAVRKPPGGGPDVRAHGTGQVGREGARAASNFNPPRLT